MFLHIYAQSDQHQEAYLVGDFASLAALKRAIDKALLEGSSSVESMAADGEGFVTIGGLSLS